MRPDLHTLNAAKMFGVHHTKVSPEMRAKAKARQYAKSYGVIDEAAEISKEQWQNAGNYRHYDAIKVAKADLPAFKKAHPEHGTLFYFITP